MPMALTLTQSRHFQSAACNAYGIDSHTSPALSKCNVMQATAQRCLWHELSLTAAGGREQKQLQSQLCHVIPVQSHQP
eukprot:1705029-Amphidinium_carterae.1